MPSPNREFEPPVRAYRFGEFELDISEDTLRKEGENLNINRRMVQVLRLLIERNGKVVSKEEFFEKVWNGSFVEDNNLTVTITAIRKVLGDDARQVRFIENLPRKGYRFIAPIDRVQYEGSAKVRSDRSVTKIAPIAESSLDSGPGQKRFRPAGHLKLYVGLLAVFMVLIVSFAVVKARINWPFGAPPVDRIDSVVVLPFEDRTVDSEYLADGLTDGIIGDLSRLSRLRVIDRNSAYQYKNKLSDPQAAGRELGVRSVVTGQIEHNGEILIITASLFDLASNTQVWRQQFRRSVTDSFATQLEISQAIAQNILSDQTGREKSRLSKSQTDDPKAYDLYLRGRYYWNKRTDVDIERSADLFRAAIDRDPTFASAYVGLAEAYTLGDFTNLHLSSEEKNAIIRGAVQKALEIDDTIGEAYAVIGINKVYHEWDLAGAESSYRRAIELNPNDATTRHWYAELLAMQGRFDESISEYDRAISLDPLSPAIRADKAFTYYYAHDYDKALELLNIANELDPDFLHTYDFLDAVYKAKGIYSNAIDQWEKHNAVDLRAGSRDVRINAVIRQKVDRLREALRSSGEAGYWRALASEAGIPPNIRAYALSKLGENDKAFEVLETALKERYSGMVWLKVSPEFDSLRSDPRYQDLLRRVGFQSE